MSLGILFWALFLVGAVGILGAIGACATLLRRVRPLADEVSFVPPAPAPLSLIVPLKGMDEHTEEHLAALVTSRFRGEVEYLFVMETADDPAYSLCTRIRALHPDHEIRIIFSGPPGARMGKQHNLAAGAREARYSVIGSMDADVRVAPTTLAVGMSYLAQPGTGIVYFLPGYTNPTSSGPGGGELVALYSNYYFLANFGALTLTRPQPAIIGALWLIRRATLQTIGGLDQFTRVVSDDAAIGKAIARQRLRCVLVPHTVSIPFESLDLAGGRRHLTKWIAMLRAEGLLTYLTILLTWHPIFWSALALLVGLVSLAADHSRWWLPGLFLFGIAALTRVITGMLLNARIYRLPVLPLPLLAVVYELVGVPVLFGAGLFRRTIEWKGRRYRLGRHGVIRGTSG